MAAREPSICVLGAGVIGLSSAVRIQDEFPRCDVTLLADRFSPDTTSDGSGGFWLPHLVGGTNQDSISKWSASTLDYMISLTKSPLANQIGVHLVSGYSFFSEPQCPEWRKLVLGYREMTDKELKLLLPKAKFGVFYTTVMINMKAYLPWLISRFKQKNGKVIQSRVDKIEDLLQKYDIVVNCTGIGANKLANDSDVIPIRGQVTRVKAPWIKHFMTYEGSDEHCEKYILPGTDTVVLGGTGQRGDWNTQIDDRDQQMIWDGCLEMIPSLKHAEVIRHWAGLRPHRSSGVRIETEKFSGGKMVVHNYGHGGAGVTLHWGCAGQVVEEIRAAIKSTVSRL